ncbi:engulfment and cell motility protein 3 isoform X3 [Pogoniulus pusillus]|uniref:engulfment and cell motility protein 3 isoform X3 n=1 Tax=Pogoniulus pusillus TaxID=488313 RepID=UPI0030B987C1
MPPPTDVVKIAIQMVGAIPQLIELHQTKPLASVLKDVCDAWSLPNAERYALQYADGRQTYITETNRREIKNGSILRLTTSPGQEAEQLYSKIQSNNLDVKADSLKKLASLSQDITFAQEFINRNGLKQIFSIVEEGKDTGEILAHTLKAFMELMEHDFVSWETLSSAFIKKVVSYANTSAVDASIQQLSLSILENMVPTSRHLFDLVKKEVTLDHLLTHLQVTSTQLQLKAMALLTALLLAATNTERRCHPRGCWFLSVPTLPSLAGGRHTGHCKGHDGVSEGEEHQAIYPQEHHPRRGAAGGRDGSPPVRAAGRRARPLRAAHESLHGPLLPGAAGAAAGAAPGGFRGGRRDPGRRPRPRPRPRAAPLALRAAVPQVGLHEQHQPRGRSPPGAPRTAGPGLHGLLLQAQPQRVQQDSETAQDFYPMFFGQDHFFEELFCICIQLVNKTWKEMRATQEDFDKVLQVVREQISRTLSLKPTSLELFKSRVNTLSYSEILRLRQTERLHQEETLPVPVLELRERLKPELLELVCQQRLQHLCQGTLFRKISTRRRQDKLWYCRLSPNHKVLHYGDMEEGMSAPPIESLPEKIPVADMKMLLVGKECLHPKEKSSGKQNKDVLELTFSIVYDVEEYCLHFIAPTRYEFCLWTDGLNVLLGREMRSERAQSDLDVLLSMELKLQLLDLENISIPDAPPPVPKPPSNLDFWVQSSPLGAFPGTAQPCCCTAAPPPATSSPCPTPLLPPPSPRGAVGHRGSSCASVPHSGAINTGGELGTVSVQRFGEGVRMTRGQKVSEAGKTGVVLQHWEHPGSLLAAGWNLGTGASAWNHHCAWGRP